MYNQQELCFILRDKPFSFPQHQHQCFLQAGLYVAGLEDISFCITADDKDEKGFHRINLVQVVQRDNAIRLTKGELLFILKICEMTAFVLGFRVPQLFY